MITSIQTLKRSILLPVVTVLSSLTLVTGQVFSCCHINESFAASLAVLFGKSRLHDAKTIAEDLEEEGHHSHCHGHGAGTSANNLEPVGKVDGSGGVIADEGNCPCDQSVVSKPMVASEFASLLTPVLAPAYLMESVPPKSMGFEKPRPQNRSSPPVYLLTLRLLV